jgi:hypothetical protein
VVALSRQFVCARLTVYEDESETQFLDKLCAHRPGDLKNSTFAMLAPDGHTPLSTVGRSPRAAYREPEDLAAAMKRVAEKYPQKEQGVRQVPYMLGIRIGLNVASCDLAPFVVVLAKDEATRARIEATLAPLAWSEEFIGRFVYARAERPEQLVALKDLPAGDGVLFVEPDVFGLEGKVLVHDPGTDPESLRAALRKGASSCRIEAKDSRKMIAEARERGITWRDIDEPPKAARKRD